MQHLSGNHIQQNCMDWHEYKAAYLDEIKEFLRSNINIVHGTRLSDFPGGIEGLIETSEKHGCILLARNDQNRIVGFCGFTYGEPSENYENKSVLYIILSAIVEEYRGIIFAKMLKKIVSVMKGKNIKTARFKSLVSNDKNNKFYDFFAKRVKQTINLAGQESILYEIDLSSPKLNLFGLMSYHNK